MNTSPDRNLFGEPMEAPAGENSSDRTSDNPMEAPAGSGNIGEQMESPTVSPHAGEPSATQPQWRPLTGRQRRVAGVLLEKAKTTPDAYPLTVNGLVSGCNQKSNRDPVMNLSADDVQGALDELRELGAVIEVLSSGRVAKYRHNLYQWLGVDKVEIAVMAELMLRGEQTVGELRGRAARMEPIADVGALRPIVQSLIDKKLVVALTPEGRGQMVTHALYPPHELADIQARIAASSSGSSEEAAPSSTAPSARARGRASQDELAELQVEVAELRAEVARLREQMRAFESRLGVPSGSGAESSPDA